MAEIYLSPDLLLEQSQEMLRLRAEYESLFGTITADLDGINRSWSDLLSHNFSGKLASAQKTFMGALNMLQNSATQTSRVANAMRDLDNARAARIGSDLYGTGGAGGHAFLPTSFLFETLMEVVPDRFKETQDILKKLDERLEELKEESGITSSQAAMLDFLGGKIKKGVMGDQKDVIETAYKIMKGDYEGALEDIGEQGFEGLITDFAESMDLWLGEGDAAKYAKYAVNVTQRAAEGITQMVLEPSWENAGRIAWNVSVQPILDTAGKDIEKVVKLIPGVSEYYYDQHGAENIGDVAQIALGDFYGLVTNDEGMRQYAANYYEESGGLWDGIWDGGAEIVSFVKDSGNPLNAAKNFVSTAVKDSEGVISAVQENFEIIHDHGGFGGAVISGVHDMAVEAWSPFLSKVWNKVTGG